MRPVIVCLMGPLCWGAFTRVDGRRSEASVAHGFLFSNTVSVERTEDACATGRATLDAAEAGADRAAKPRNPIPSGQK